MLWGIAKGIMKGKSLLRTLMNLELRCHSLHGRVLDVGGGKDPSYFGFLKREKGTEVINIDGINTSINFERDPLPYRDISFDQALLCNVLEHVYNYKFLLVEIKRVLKDGGEIVGFVPFLINYHPDPHDYFRYTKEALEKIFTECGFHNVAIKEVGLGPFAVAFNALAALPAPRFLKAIAFPFFYFSDHLLLLFRPVLALRYPLGFLFTLKK